MNSKTYDACFITFTELLSDARTLNTANSLIKNNKKVAIIAFADENEIQFFKNSKIDLYSIPYPKSKKIWYRWFYFCNKSKLLKGAIKSEVLWAADLYSLYSARNISKETGSILYYDSREIYSALGPLANQKLKQKIIALIEKRSIKKVNKIIVSGELDAEYLKNHFKNGKSYEVIMNLPPYSIPQKSNFIREKLNIPDNNIILIYQGMLLPGRGLEKAIESLQYINNSVLVIVGDGYFKTYLQQLTRKLKLTERVFFCGRVPYNELFKWTCSADIGLVLIEPISLSYKLALPNKLFEYCIANVPSIVSDLPAMRKIIEKYNIGKLIPTDSRPNAVALAIQEVYNNKNSYTEFCKTAAMELNYESQEKVILSLFN